MNLSRAHVLGLLGAAALLPSCGGSSNAIRVGSKNFTEEFILAEFYAQALEGAGLTVERRFNLGSTQIAMEALERGEIDLYPEYTGTMLIDVLHHAPMSDPKAIYDTIKAAYAKQYNLTVLTPAPMNDSQALATTKAIATKYGLTTLSQLAKVSSQLRLATIPEFLTRADGLPGLQQLYGGFHFADMKSYDIGLKYDALLQGKADIATAFTTDGAIAANHLVVLDDDRHLWPPYNPAPVIRTAVLAKYPQITTLMAGYGLLLDNASVSAMNGAVENGKQDPADVVAAFIKEHHPLSAGAAIAFAGVDARYESADRNAVNGVSLSVPTGAFATIVGPSGCGKSTLLRTVNRLVPLQAGTITLDGVDTATLDPVTLRREIGYAIQAVGLFAHMTIAQNIGVVPELLGWSRDAIAARVDELLALVHLEPKRYRGRYPRDLSGGEAQRVGVARAIAAKPRVLLLDEPFGAVDAIVRASLQDELLRIVRDLDTTVLFVTHDVDEALKLADRVIVMRAGEIVRDGTPLEVLEDPRDEYVRDLLGDDETRAFRLTRAKRTHA